MARKKSEKIEDNQSEIIKEESEVSTEDIKETKKQSENKAAKPSWIKMSKQEMEKIVVDLAKKGETPAKIGLILRDSYGIPKARILGKKITEILREHKIDFKSDRAIIEEKLKPLREHISKNKHDYTAKRALTKKLWAVHNLKKYEAANAR